MTPLSLGIVTDEISTDFTEALSHAQSWGVSTFEIRCLASGRVPFISDEDFNALRAAVEDGIARITALSPGIFKCSVFEKEKVEHELNAVLPKTIAMAKALGCGMVITFGFKRAEPESEEEFTTAIEWMSRAARIAKIEDVILAVENEPGFVCDTGSNTAALLRAVGSPSLRANWDPANAFGCDEAPYPDGYEALKPFIANVHVKDTVKGSLVECCVVGEGRIDWKGQLAALLRDGIVRHVTIETHCLPLIAKSKQNIDTLRQYFSELTEAEP
jgi:sugar phosphate isomerase/epimerase